MPSQIGDKVQIRWMLRSDYPEILEIAESIPDGFRTEDDIRAAVKARNRIGMVADYARYVAGYMVYGLHPTRYVVRHFAVAPGLRRRGVGRKMATQMTSRLSPYHRTRIDFDAPDDNLDLHLFLKAMGFRAVMLPTADTYRFTYAIPAAVPDDCEGAIP